MNTTDTEAVIGRGATDALLSEDDAREILAAAFDAYPVDGKRVLVIIPDATRTAPIPLFFRLLVDLLGERTAALDFLVALGTHPAMSEDALNRLVGVSAEERAGRYADVGVYNHAWYEEGTLVNLGTIPADEIETLTDGMLRQDVEVTVNRMLFDYDRVVVCGPTFPHEVVGFSGGNKYFFPGVSGPEVINFTHWVGALLTSYDVIGTAYTPVRAVIDRAAAMIDVDKLCCSLVVTPRGSLAGLYVGAPEDAWAAAAELSSRIHIRWVERPFRRVLSVMPEMYDDIWTASKGMYKLEPVIADGGEVIIYAPHIDEISYSHGAVLDEIGYHVRDYFLAQWDRFKDKPWGVLAHSTHLRGIGTYEDGVERPRIRVTLATRIPPERCAALNLGYLDPDSIDFDDWRDREDEGILFVPKAGELLYRLKPT